jgi:hypothetical protein
MNMGKKPKRGIKPRTGIDHGRINSVNSDYFSVENCCTTSYAFQNAKDQDIQNNNFVHCFVWV